MRSNETSSGGRGDTAGTVDHTTRSRDPASTGKRPSTSLAGAARAFGEPAVAGRDAPDGGDELQIGQRVLRIHAEVVA
jgi:hypothetical protein